MCDVVVVLCVYFSSDVTHFSQPASSPGLSPWWAHGGSSNATVCASSWDVGRPLNGPGARGDAPHDDQEHATSYRVCTTSTTEGQQKE